MSHRTRPCGVQRGRKKGNNMYQVKYTAGYEIQVIGQGEKGLCRVTDNHNAIQISGTYSECEKWLSDRKIAQHGHRVTAADIAEAGRGNR